MRYGQPVEACGTRLNPEAPGSYKIIYSGLTPPDVPDVIPRTCAYRSTSIARSRRSKVLNNGGSPLGVAIGELFGIQEEPAKEDCRPSVENILQPCEPGAPMRGARYRHPRPPQWPAGSARHQSARRHSLAITAAAWHKGCASGRILSTCLPVALQSAPPSPPQDHHPIRRMRLPAAPAVLAPGCR